MRATELFNLVTTWANNRDLLHEENVPKQMMKVIEELGELNAAIIKDDDNEIIDGIGDVLVTVIILARQLNLNPEACLRIAYKEISERKGKTVDGVFIKEKNL